MMDGYYPIAIDGEIFSPKKQTDAAHELEWQEALREAKIKRHIPQCQCKPDVDNQLVVRRHQSSREYYGLAKYPYQGATHHSKCRFYASEPERSGMQGYTKKVVEELDDGNFKIKLELDRQVRELGKPSSQGSTAVKTGAPRPKKQAMRLLGLLHFLFNLGRLNVWYRAMRGKRTWPVVARVLSEEASRIVCGSAMLSDQLLMGIKVDFSKKDTDTSEATQREQPVEQEDRGRESRSRIKAMNEKNRSAAETNMQRLVAIGMLSSYEWVTRAGKEPLPGTLKFSQYDGLPYMKMDAEMWEIAKEHNPIGWSAWLRGDPVCAIVRLQFFEAPLFAGARKITKDWKVLDIALQSLSESFIPVESSHENRVAQKLVAEDRIFEKPLRFEAGEDEIFPDFILLDTDQDQYPMEVFGRTDEPYEKREAEKCSYYKKHFENNWWCWKVASSKEVIPELPEKDN